MQTALYWLDVSHISKRHAPGTVSAHMNYILRDSARNEVISVNLPTNKHALKRELAMYEEWAEENTRKDARLLYKIMHALPVQMSRRQQIEATRRFCWELSGKGRARVAAVFHDLDSHNPHVHIAFIDRDIETGKSVALLSASKSERAAKGLDPNSTVWLRKLWEFECNGVFAEAGMDYRIDHRTNLEQGLAAARDTHRGWADPALESPEVESEESAEDQEVTDHSPDVENMLEEPEIEEFDEFEDLEDELECPPMPVDAPPEVDTVDDLSDDEEDMETDQKLTPQQATMVASQFMDELRDLRLLRAKLEGYTKALASATAQLETASAESTEAHKAKTTAERQKYAAEEQLKQFQTERGLAGRSFSIGFGKWKLEWKSALRKQGEQAVADFERISSALERAEHAVTSADNQVKRWENTEAERRKNVETTQQQIDDMLATYGESATLESAEETLNHTAHLYLSEVDVEDLIDLYESGQISTAQYRDALELKGAEEELAALQGEQVENLDERIEQGLH